MKTTSSSSNLCFIKKEVFLSHCYVYLPMGEETVGLERHFLHRARSYDVNGRYLYKFLEDILKAEKNCYKEQHFR